MSSEVLQRISTDLSEVGHSVTSYDELGVEFDEAAASELVRVVGRDVFDPDALQHVTNIDDMQGMIIAKGAETLRLGKTFMEPVVAALFRHNPQALNGWSLYGLNRYDAGGTFEPHMDSTGGTVIVATLSGERELDVYRREPDQHHDHPETFREIEYTRWLGRGSILLVDGELDPPHAVRCITPSASTVVDVPVLLRV